MRFPKAHVLVAGLVFTTGLLPIISLLTHHFYRQVDTIFSLGVLRASHLLTISLAFLLLYLSAQLFRRKQYAYRLTIISLCFLIISSIVHEHFGERFVLYVVSLVLLVANRKLFDVQSDNLSLRRGLLVAALILSGAIGYAAAGFYLLDRRDFGIDFTVLQSLHYAIIQVVTFDNKVLLPTTEHARFFLDSVDLISLVSLSVAAAALFKPLRFSLHVSSSDYMQVERILRKYSDSPEDYFKLYPADKHYFFNAAEDAFVAYKVSGDSALILDGPSGNSKKYKRLLKDFTAFSRKNGWTPAIIHGDESVERVIGSEYRSLFVGNEAMVDVTTFTQTTFRSKHFRYIKNKAAKEGLEFEYWQAPLNKGQITALKAVSDEWVGRDGRREYTFVMGYFSDEYLRDCNVGVLIKDGECVAYTNVIPTYVPESRSIDHMRYRSGVPSVAMHYLLMQLIIMLETKGAKWFNLGLSPLSGLENREKVNAPEKVLKAVKVYGGRYYSFGGLEQFKNKFEPIWQPRFIYYPTPATNLIKTAANLSRATAMPVSAQKRVRLLISASVVAALAYCSFPLGLELNEQSGGIVSNLGALGQPYNWVFNGLDVLSGSILIAIAAYTYYSVKALSRRHGLIAGLLAVGGLGGLLAGLSPLPIAGADSLTSQTALHISFSTVNGVGIFLAATVYVLYMAWPYKQYLALLLYGTYIAAAILAVVGFQTALGDVSQRINIIVTASWMILLTIELARAKLNA